MKMSIYKHLLPPKPRKPQEGPPRLTCIGQKASSEESAKSKPFEKVTETPNEVRR